MKEAARRDRAKVIPTGETAANLLGFSEQGLTGKVPHDKDPSVFYVRYPSLYTSQKSYAKPVVKIEISCLPMAEPFEAKRVSSLVEMIQE